MKSLRSLSCLLPCVTLAACLTGFAADDEPRKVHIAVDLDAESIPVAPTMHGLFYEDINYAADGGIYAELVQNRSFEHNDPLYAWTGIARGNGKGSIEAAKKAPLNAKNPTYLSVKVSDSTFGIANDGFTGIPVQAGESYQISLYARSAKPDLALSAIIESTEGKELARVDLPSPTGGWKKLEATLRPTETDPAARLIILAHSRGELHLDMISLFPKKTFKNRPNGIRADLGKTLADMQPRFLRFPGGCIIEGHGLHNAYRWKDTVGDIAERPQNFNLWRNPAFPQYHQTYGLGFFEYFQLAEDIGAEPIPVVNCGMACQARGGVHAPIDKLDEWLQDAVDLIEFANGPPDSRWGAVRAAMGREQPFNLRYLTIGNEQWGQEYFDRYQAFYRLLTERHPEIQLISTSGPFVDDPSWRLAWGKFNSGEASAHLVDEHYYVTPDWLLSNSDRYERYERNGPKVQVGEYAAHEPDRRSTLRAAVAEASYMTGLLRHADVVRMAAYAPLFARRDHSQWEPNLIWFDNNQVLLTASYHVQAIYGQNRPDRILPTRVTGEPPPPPTVGGRIGLGTWNTQAEFKDIAVTAPDGTILYRSDFARDAAEWDFTRGEWAIQNGVLQQTQQTTDRYASAGDPAWGDYTLSLRARKLGGDEGFMIFFGVGEQGMGHWNLGGWGNNQHGLSIPSLPLAQRPGRIETGRWYDIRIELRGTEIAAFLDGERLQTASLARVRHKALYTVAGRDDKANELILYLANPSSQPIAASFDLNGETRIRKTARLIRLNGDPNDVNTWTDPDRIQPSITAIKIPGARFDEILPPSSFSVLRIPLTQ